MENSQKLFLSQVKKAQKALDKVLIKTKLKVEVEHFTKVAKFCRSATTWIILHCRRAKPILDSGGWHTEAIAASFVYKPSLGDTKLSNI